MALSHFKLANLFPNSFSLTIFTKIYQPHARRKKIKTCHKNCNTLIAEKKIRSRTFQISKVTSEENLVSFALLVSIQQDSALNKSVKQTKQV